MFSHRLVRYLCNKCCKEASSFLLQRLVQLPTSQLATAWQVTSGELFRWFRGTKDIILHHPHTVQVSKYAQLQQMLLSQSIFSKFSSPNGFIVVVTSFRCPCQLKAFPAFTLTQLLLPPRDYEPRLGVALDAVSHVWIQFLQRPAKRRMRKIKISFSHIQTFTEWKTAFLPTIYTGTGPNGKICERWHYDYNKVATSPKV